MHLKPTLILLAALVLGACNNIVPEDRFIEVASATVKRKVLVEEFTGQRCLNCPEAANELARLQAQYGGDTLIVVAIHGGRLAVKPTASVNGLFTALGDSYAKFWGFTNSVPNALINRKPAGQQKDAWAGIIRQAFENEGALNLRLATTYDGTSRELKVTTTTAALANKVQGKLQLWLVEDGIVSIQQLPGNVTEPNYVHNHVLRATLNGDWGEDVSIDANNEKTFTHTLTLPNGVNADKAWVVAFVYNDDGVVQVDRHKVAN